jgi:hypothetical protein
LSREDFCYAESRDEYDGVAKRAAKEHGDIGDEGIAAHDAQGDKDGVAKKGNPTEKPHEGTPALYQTMGSLHMPGMDVEESLYALWCGKVTYIIAGYTSQRIA